MREGWKYHRFEKVHKSDLGNGFLGSDLVVQDGFELTFIEGEAGAGHGSHRHEQQDEILVVLEGGCRFNVGGTDIKTEGGSLLHIHAGVDHSVRYKVKSTVLRIKIRTSTGPLKPMVKADWMRGRA